MWRTGDYHLDTKWGSPGLFMEEKELDRESERE